MKLEPLKFFKRYYPAFIEHSEEIHQVNTIDDVLNLEFVKNFTKDEVFKFSRFVFREYYNDNFLLMAMYNLKDCEDLWYVVGTFQNFTEDELFTKFQKYNG